MGRLLLLFTIWLIALPALAQHPITLEHAIGFGRILPPNGETYPVTLDLSNKGIPVSGVIELRRMAAGSSAAEVTRRFPFTLPAPSQKRFVLPAPGGAEAIECVVRFEQDLPPLRRELRGKSARKPLILAWNAHKAYGMKPWIDAVHIAPTKPSSFPADPQLARGVRGIIASGMVLTSLPKDIDRSLQRWLSYGGTLVIDNPPPTPAFSDWFKHIAGVPFSQGPEGAAHSTPVDFGRIVTRSGRFAAGNLADDTLAFDLEWAEKDDFASFTSTTVGQTGVLDSAWKTNRTYGGWTLLIVALIIVGYIVLTGPVEYILTVKKQRYRLVWPLYLGSIVAFSVLAYSYSRIANLGEMRAVTAAIIDVCPLRGELRGSGIGWIYSSANRSYTLESTAPETVLQFREGGLGQSSLARVGILDGSASGATARIPIYSSKWFSGRWTAPTQATITRPTTGNDRVEITLPEGLKIDGVWLAAANGIIRLHPGDDRTFRLPNSADTHTTTDQLRDRFKTEHADSQDLPSPKRLADIMTWVTFDVHSENSHFSGSSFNQRPSEFEADWIRPHPGKKSPPMILVTVDNPDTADWISFSDANPSRRSNILFRFPVPPPGAQP